jgi:hypothetical protein
MKTTNFEDPHYAALSIVLSLPVFLCPNILEAHYAESMFFP